jgi:putative membrane protein
MTQDPNTSSGKSVIDKAQDAIGAAVGMASASTLGSHSAQAFLRNAMASNLYEIEAARLAEQRGQTVEVRELAQKMIRDHETLGTKMRHSLADIGAVEAPEEKLDNRRQGMIDNLRDAPADGFDRTYLDQQFTAHREAVTLFQGYAENGDNAELKGLAAAAVPILQEHLEHVIRLRGH